MPTTKLERSLALNYERGITAALMIATIAAGYLHFKVRNQRDRPIQNETKNQAYVIMDDEFREDRVLWWPGFRGESPKYFVDAGLKGYGYEEFPAMVIKKRLAKEFGIKIIDWNVSHARIEHEFTSKRRPICIYPYKWKNPDKEFVDRPPFLYSLGMVLGGDLKRKVLLRNDALEAISSFLDEIGNLKLAELIKSKKFTTNLISGQTYPEQVSFALIQNSDGSQSVLSEYQKSITLMVASDNSQLLMMLKNRRIDYVLEELVTDEHYEHLGIDKDEFLSIVFENINIKDVRDPNLQFYSVRCNDHPFNYKIMNQINQIIRKNRGFSNALPRWRRNLKKFDEFTDPLVTFSDIAFTLAYQINTNSIDKWYEEKYLPHFGKDSFGDLSPIESNMRFTSKIPSRAPRFAKLAYAIQGDHLVVLPPSDFSLIRISKNWPLRVNRYSDQLDFLLAKQIQPVAYTVVKETNELEMNLDRDDYPKFRHITIRPSTMPDTKILKLMKSAQDLKSIEILFPKKSFMRSMAHLLPKSLIELRIVGADLWDVDLASRLKKNRLEVVDLSQVGIDSAQIVRLLDGHSDSLKTIKIRNHNFFLEESFYQFMESHNFESLREFEMDITDQASRNTTRILNALPARLEHLVIGQNLYPEHLPLILKRFKFLKKLNICGIVVKDLDKVVRLPESLEYLALSFWSDKQKIDSILIPETLKFLSLNNVNISSTLANDLGNRIPSGLESMFIGGNRIPKAVVRKIFFNRDNKPYSWISNLRHLEVSSMRVDDQLLTPLLKKATKLEYLDLSDNLLTDKVVGQLEENDHLRNLFINDNFFTKKGIEALLTGFRNKSLEVLDISNISDIDVISLAKNIPSSLKALYIERNNLSANELGFLAENKASRNVQVFSDENFHTMESLLTQLYYNPWVHPVEGVSGITASTKQLIAYYEALPDTTLELATIESNITGEQEVQDSTFPKGVLRFRQQHNTMGEKFRNSFMQHYPGGIRDVLTSHFDEDEFGLLARKGKFEDLSVFGATVTRNDKKWEDSFVHHVNQNMTFFLGYVNAKRSAILLEKFSRLRKIQAYAFAKNFKSFLIKKPKSTGFLNNMTFLGSCDDACAKFFAQFNLKHVDRLHLMSSQMTDVGIVTFLQAISKEPWEIDISNSSLSYKGVDNVIMNLPDRLAKLVIRGNSIGARGFQKFRRWGEAHAKKHGFKPLIIE